MQKHVGTLALVLLPLGFGCSDTTLSRLHGSDAATRGDSSSPSDAGRSVGLDAAAVMTDAGTLPDAGALLDDASLQDGGTAADAGITCTQVSFPQQGQATASDLTTLYFTTDWTDPTMPSTPRDRLYIQLFYQLQATRTGTYALGATPEERDYATCTQCVFIRTAAPASFSQSCDRSLQLQCPPTDFGGLLFAQSGTLVIHDIDLRTGFRGELKDVTFAQVTATAPYHTALVPGGKTECLSSFTFSSTIAGVFPCERNSDCTDPVNPVCYPSGSFCMQCLTTDDCATYHNPNGPFCRTGDNICVHCLDNTACTNPAKPYCAADGSCAQCVDSSQCAGNPNGPACSNGVCIRCASSFDCTSTQAPYCGQDAAGNPICEVIDGMCTSDDPTENANDGPAGARPLASSATGLICSANFDEEDWFKYGVAATSTVTFGLTWVDPQQSVHLFLYDSMGNFIDSSENQTAPQQIVQMLTPGTYYLQIFSFALPGNGISAATSYTISAH
jgi:hypothetical protein